VRPTEPGRKDPREVCNLRAVTVLVVTGTGTGVGKTVVTAAVAALAADRGSAVAVVKPAQTGVLLDEPGDLDDVRRLSGVADLHELARYPDPLSPAAAARFSGLAPLALGAAARAVSTLSDSRRLVLVEGAGGLLVRFDDEGWTVADLAVALGASVVVVSSAGLGSLNSAALTLEALAHRGVDLAGLVIGEWPAEPDLACRSNVRDLETLAARPLAGALPAGAGHLRPGEFLEVAKSGLGPTFGGRFDPVAFRAAVG
jgi:dethiobiotin synthetase